jgi:hypothetical protein
LLSASWHDKLLVGVPFINKWKTQKSLLFIGFLLELVLVGLRAMQPAVYIAESPQLCPSIQLILTHIGVSMNKRQKPIRASRMKERRIALRKELWPDFDFDLLWDRTQNDGYTTMPRPLLLISKIMDYLAPEAKPVSKTYLSLWCRVPDEMLIAIRNENDMAFEAGFSGQRAVTGWRSRMKILVELGFIEVNITSTGNYQYVLILNPYRVIKKFKEKNKIPKYLYVALLARAQEVGADGDLK